MRDVILESVVTCPHCGWAQRETLPAGPTNISSGGRPSLYGAGWAGGLAFAIGIFTSILIALEFGRLVWRWQVASGREPETTGVGAVASAIFCPLPTWI
ncbi:MULTISPECIES: hypothetical protein [Cupriavidus]|jgi:hypothetical protein|uniref:hypothetical protein n=1 Tax=Cupriavidus TaxID=106589 RepID=UPI001E3D1472|nr:MULTISPECIES: hypothetical protein [Cupriavidus]